MEGQEGGEAQGAADPKNCLLVSSPSDHGCQIFLGTIYQNGEKISNYHKIYRMEHICKIFIQECPFPYRELLSKGVLYEKMKWLKKR
jgi:hypothetical protein